MRQFLISVIVFLLTVAPVSAAFVYPADPDAYSKQWHLQKIEAYEAWSKTQGSNEVVVAVIDTGIDLDHFDLTANIWKNSREALDGFDNDHNGYVDDATGWDFYDGDNDPSPDVDEKIISAKAVHHGTLVAGLIGAVGNNGIGGVGVAWKVKIMPLRALDSQGRGNVGTVIEAVVYAINNGADIINLSFVGPGYDPDLFAVLQNALRKGILTVAAVGNMEEGNGADLDRFPLYPVCYSGSEGEDAVLGVAATDAQDKKSLFSNYGKNCVDLTAPGTDMYGPVYNNPARGFQDFFGDDFSGSSMAAPLVTGTAALIKALNPSYAAQEIRNILVQSADSIEASNPEYNGKLGQGRLNARRALELAAAGGSAVFGPSRGVPYLITAPFSNALPQVQMLLGSGTPSRSFMAYGANFRGGMNLSAGDLDKNRSFEIVTGAGFGGGPHVRVFKPDGAVVGSFFAYNSKFRGGVKIGVGDTNGDGQSEIVTAPGPGGGPHIRIFDIHGKVLGSFFAYDSWLNGGANLTVADIDGDDKAEIITAPGSGAGYAGEIRVFDFRGKLKHSFNAYPANFIHGVNVAVGNLDGAGFAEIITAPAKGTLPEVRVYSAEGKWQRAFLAYTESFTGGVNLVAGDLDRDGLFEIITGPGNGGGSHIIVFDGFGRVKNQFSPMDKDFRGGVSVGVIKL